VNPDSWFGSSLSAVLRACNEACTISTVVVKKLTQCVIAAPVTGAWTFRTAGRGFRAEMHLGHSLHHWLRW
jgi:hypothetical protein